MLEKLKFIYSSISTFLWPFIRLFLKQGGALLATAALNAVTIVAASMQDADGAQKREAAFKMIQAELIAGGISLAASAINAAIEAAYQKYLADQS